MKTLAPAKSLARLSRIHMYTGCWFLLLREPKALPFRPDIAMMLRAWSVEPQVLGSIRYSFHPAIGIPCRMERCYSIEMRIKMQCVILSLESE